MDYPLLENKLPKSIKKVWRNTGLLNLAITSIGFFVGVFLSFNDNFEGIWFFVWIIYMIFMGLIFIPYFILIPFRYNYFCYEITEDDIVYQKGFFFRKITYVPINRIQHIETEQGPFLRLEKLMELKIHTAATVHRIAGLSIEDSLSLREQIIEKMKEASEDV